jgi:hypothetical protein
MEGSDGMNVTPRTCHECPRWFPPGARTGDCSVGIETFWKYPICDAMRCFLGLPSHPLHTPSTANAVARCYICGLEVRTEERAAVLPTRRGVPGVIHQRCIDS